MNIDPKFFEETAARIQAFSDSNQAMQDAARTKGRQFTAGMGALIELPGQINGLVGQTERLAAIASIQCQIANVQTQIAQDTVVEIKNLTAQTGVLVIETAKVTRLTGVLILLTVALGILAIVQIGLMIFELSIKF